MQKIAVFLLGVIAVTQANAGDSSAGGKKYLYNKSHPPLRYGVGSDSCGKYLDASTDPVQQAIYGAYFSGWATQQGILLGADIFYGTDAAGMKHWIMNYCTSNPTSYYSDAVSAYTQYSFERYSKDSQ